MSSNVRLKPANKILNLNVMDVIMPLVLVLRDQYPVQDLDDAVLGHPVPHRDVGEAIDADGREAPESRNVDTDARLTQEGAEVVVLPAARSVGLVVLARLVVERIAVERRVGRDVVLEKRLEVLLALLRVEEERVRAGAEAPEGVVAGSEDGAARHLDSVDELHKVCLFVREKQRRKLAGE